MSFLIANKTEISTVSDARHPHEEIALCQRVSNRATHVGKG